MIETLMLSIMPAKAIDHRRDRAGLFAVCRFSFTAFSSSLLKTNLQRDGFPSHHSRGSVGWAGLVYSNAAGEVRRLETFRHAGPLISKLDSKGSVTTDKKDVQCPVWVHLRSIPERFPLFLGRAPIGRLTHVP
jgi:hypothetical protein